MGDLYHDGNRELQRRFDTERLAARLEQANTKAEIDERARAFIEGRDMFFLATVDADGHANCSYKGGEPGFVRVVDGQTLAFPSYDGNGMFLSMGNVLASGEVGLLFVDFEEQARMRVNGRASIDFEDPLLDHYPGAQFVVRVKAREVFSNCPRYIHKLKLVERSAFVPSAQRTTPIAEWKAGIAAGEHRGLLPADDPALVDPS